MSLPRTTRGQPLALASAAMASHVSLVAASSNGRCPARPARAASMTAGEELMSTRPSSISLAMAAAAAKRSASPSASSMATSSTRTYWPTRSKTRDLTRSRAARSSSSDLSRADADGDRGGMVEGLFVAEEHGLLAHDDALRLGAHADQADGRSLGPGQRCLGLVGRMGTVHRYLPSSWPAAWRRQGTWALRNRRSWSAEGPCRYRGPSWA